MNNIALPAIILSLGCFMASGCDSGEKARVKELELEILKIREVARLEKEREDEKLRQQKLRDEEELRQRKLREEEERQFCCCETKKYITKFEINFGAWMDNFIYDGSEYRWGNRESCGGTVNTGSTFNPAKTVKSCTSRSECGR